MRIGFGFDVHRLVEGREFWLGGVRIQHDKGALGHSDADVLIHAICDALLGAACLGDIGKHFPDTSAEFKNVDSKILLRTVIELIDKEGYRIENIDSSLTLEKPKIAPYIEQMREALSPIVNLPMNRISIKATTNEKMGFIGREEGLVAYAVVLLQEK